MRDQRGFTLVELLVTMVLGLVVVGGVFNLVMASQRSSRRIADRTDATQRGRIALNAMAQEIRAMTCLADDTRPIVSATDTQLTWYANLDQAAWAAPTATPTPTPTPNAFDTNGDGDQSFDPQARRLTVTGTAASPTGIREELWAPTVTATNLTTAPVRTRVLVDALAPLTPATPVFRYYGYADAAASEPDQVLPSPVANPERIARIDIAFLARPSSQGADPASTSPMDTSVYVRTMDRDASAGAPIPTYTCTS
jgi:prepilin-type N-terminal cleavage/methylation domain-containing protein